MLIANLTQNEIILALFNRLEKLVYFDLMGNIKENTPQTTNFFQVRLTRREISIKIFKKLYLSFISLFFHLLFFLSNFKLASNDSEQQRHTYIYVFLYRCFLILAIVEILKKQE